jgi:hypothetical protein
VNIFEGAFENDGYFGGKYFAYGKPKYTSIIFPDIPVRSSRPL